MKTSRALPYQGNQSLKQVSTALRLYGKTVDDANITDLLTDLRHWCEANGVSFHDAVEMSSKHYEAERAGEL